MAPPSLSHLQLLHRTRFCAGRNKKTREIFFDDVSLLSRAQYCHDRVCVSVCVFVCPRTYLRTRPIFTKFLCTLRIAVARSSSGGVAMRCVLPVLWMTSHLVVPMTFAWVAPPANDKNGNCSAGRRQTDYLIRRTQVNQLSNKLAIVNNRRLEG